MSGENDPDLLFCSFCGKSQETVRNLIAGPAVFICDECVILCAEIVKEEDAKRQFGDRLDATMFIDDMQAIDRIDPETFRNVCSHISGVLNGLRSEGKKKRIKSSPKI